MLHNFNKTLTKNYKDGSVVSYYYRIQGNREVLSQTTKIDELVEDSLLFTLNSNSNLSKNLKE